jgi:hypothetical protein
VATDSAFPLSCDEAQFRALAVTFVPEASSLGKQDWQEAYQLIGSTLSQRPRLVTRQLSLFVRVLNFLSVAKHRRGVTKLSSAERQAFLESIAQSSWALLRKGLWGLRTLVFMGYYARPSAGEQLGYHAEARGWARVREVRP